MFQFFFKYPLAIFAKGHFALLSAWPKWLLALLVVAAGVGLAVLIYSRLPKTESNLRNWRAGVLWLLEFVLAAILLTLIWQPALVVAQLKPQQNIIAVLVDSSKSMATADQGMARETQAVNALQGGVLTSLQKEFQTRLYQLDNRLTRIQRPDQLKPAGASTQISEGLRQLTAETAGLPLGAVVLFSDGADNSGGIDRETIAQLRERRIPVHTVGLGDEKLRNDVEIDDAVMPPQSMADSRLTARISFHQSGFSGKRSKLIVRDGQKILAARDFTFGSEGGIQTEPLLFNAGSAGVRSLQFSVEPVAGETNTSNNSVTRVINVDSKKRRILYLEGEPRWQYKFIRRAEDDDRIVHLVSMLRTTENKIYRQGIDNPQELADGFPTKVEELFEYDGIIIGSVEAGYFTPEQQQLLRDFADKRGGGILFLGGRASLSDGIWGASNLADLLPVELPSKSGTFHRDPATVELTSVGIDSLITRLLDDPQKNADRWKKLPYVMDYQDPGSPKPGAAVLADMHVGNRKMPFLITQNYGRGRTAVLASGGTWRWQMSQPLGDTTHNMFWQQLLRWLVMDTPGHVTSSMPNQMLFDEGRVKITAEVRDKNYLPAGDSKVAAHIIGPDNLSEFVPMSPVQDNPGIFQLEWTAQKPGPYVAEISAQKAGEEAGRSTVPFQRLDGVAENLRVEQNKPLLEGLAAETNGKYWKLNELSQLSSEIPLSEAGITVRENKELWNMPAIFLVLLLLRGSEWLLRRKWGAL